MGEVVPARNLADPTSLIPSHCAVIIPVSKCPSASIVVTSTLKELNIKKYGAFIPKTHCTISSKSFLH